MVIQGRRFRVHSAHGEQLPRIPDYQLRSMTAMTEPSHWGTVKDAATLLGVHPMTIRRYINAGELPARRKGVKLIEVDLDHVRRLMAPIQPTVTRAGTYAREAGE